MTDEDTTVKIADEDFEMDAEEFVEALETADRLETRVRRIEGYLDELTNGPLEDEHVRDILYSEVPRASKSNIKTLFGVVDDIERKSDHRLAVRLVSSMTSLNLSQAQDILDELEHLDEVYGDRLKEDER